MQGKCREWPVMEGRWQRGGTDQVKSQSNDFRDQQKNGKTEYDDIYVVFIYFFPVVLSVHVFLIQADLSTICNKAWISTWHSESVKFSFCCCKRYLVKVLELKLKNMDGFFESNSMCSVELIQCSFKQLTLCNKL